MAAVYFVIDDVIATVNGMLKDTKHDSQGFALTNSEAWNVWEYNEAIKEVSDKLTDTFKKGIPSE